MKFLSLQKKIICFPIRKKQIKAWQVNFMHQFKSMGT